MNKFPLSAKTEIVFIHRKRKSLRERIIAVGVFVAILALCALFVIESFHGLLVMGSCTVLVGIAAVLVFGVATQDWHDELKDLSDMDDSSINNLDVAISISPHAKNIVIAIDDSPSSMITREAAREISEMAKKEASGTYSRLMMTRKSEVENKDKNIDK